MARMLVLSDNLSLPGILVNIITSNGNIHKWTECPQIPRPSDYEIFLLDLKISKQPFHQGAFFGLRQEIEVLLKAGGVVICLNYFTVPTIMKIHYHSKESALEGKDIILAQRDERFETNYDWVYDELLLSRLNIAQVDAKVGTNFELVTKNKLYTKYFEGVSEYHKSVNAVEETLDDEGRLSGHHLSLKEYNDIPIEVIAVSKVTKHPIASAVYLERGTLILLPQSNEDAQVVLGKLYAIGKAQYEKNMQKIEKLLEPPEWVSKYKTQHELMLDKKIEELNAKIDELKLSHKKFDKIDVLLYGTGNQLEDAVEETLKDMGCTIEKLEKGATVDFKAHLNGMNFVIEVTGIDDKVYKDNKHFSQILQYLPYREENERIVFLVNTYRETDIDQRNGKEHFTKPVTDLSRDNHFCLMTTSDLYFIWHAFKNGAPSGKMLAQVFGAEGEFRFSKPSNTIS